MLHLPGGIVDERQFAKIIALFQCGHRSFAVNHDVHGSFQQNVPRTTLVALVEYLARTLCFGGRI